MKKCFAFILALFVMMPTISHAQSVYDRVIESGKIRCGYFVASPYISFDADTGTLGGIWYDMMELIGEKLDLEIDWSMEVGLADYVAALNTDKIDMYCGGLWINPSRAKVHAFTAPVAYKTVDAFVRKGDTRFDNDKAAINDPDVTIAFIDGEMASLIAAADFSDAKTLSFPQLSSLADPLLSIKGEKADITFTSQDLIDEFAKSHGEVLQKVKFDYPLRIFPEAFGVKHGEVAMKDMISEVSLFLVNHGDVDRILKKYEKNQESWYRVNKPYEVAQ